MKAQKRSGILLWGSAVMAVIIALALTTATYAWFTSNRQVSTDRVTAQAGSASLELQISRTGGENFSPGTRTNASGETVNAVALQPLEGELMPVSTADLKTFLYCPQTNEDRAERFVPVQSDSFYYHDTVYLRAVGPTMDDGAQVMLYLGNDDENPLVRADSGELLTAARLGITVDGGAPVILRLSSEPDRGAGNTYLNGALSGAGVVLAYPEETVTAVPDPAISIQDVLYGGSHPLVTMELGRIYQVDFYFYLEGCDPDCLRERVALSEAYLNPAFFALLG